MQRQTLLVLVAIAAGASAQLFTGGLSGFKFSGVDHLCGQTLDDANATGVYSWNPGVPQFKQPGQPDNKSGKTLPIQIAATVSEVSGVQNASVQWGIWWSTLGANYSNDFGLGYDSCAFAIETTSLDFLYRAQNDNGDCRTAMSDECVNDIQTQTRTRAYDLTFDPTLQQPRANQTADSVYDVCNMIRKDLIDNYPQSCQIFMNDTFPITVSGNALSSNNYSYLYEQCSMTDSTSNNVYHHVSTYTKYTLDNPTLATEYYDILNWLAVPIITIIMPIANSKAPASISTAVSKLQCIRANTVNPGSVKPAKAPAPTPLSSGGGLSGGAIAGIVIGVLAAVGIIAGLAFFFFRRKRKQTQKLETFDPDEKQGPPGPFEERADDAHTNAVDTKSPVVEAGDTPVKELSPDNEVAKPGTHAKPAELEGTDGVPLEKEASGVPLEKEASNPPAELLAHVPSSPESAR